MVHMLSNHGHSMWLELLRRHNESLQGRVAAIVFDCAPGAENSVQPSHVVNGIVFTIRMALAKHGLAGRVKLAGKARLEATAQCVSHPSPCESHDCAGPPPTRVSAAD